MSSVDTFTKVNCSHTLTGSFPKPSYHPTKPNVVVISTQNWASNKGIFEYDLRENVLTKIHTYNESFKIFGHGQFIYPKKSLLYIFAAGELGVFDLNNKKMYTNQRSGLRNCRDIPRTAYISTDNKCHILSDNCMHYTLDMNNNKMTKMSIDIFEHNNIKWPNLSYIPFTKQLMCFGSHYSDKIWYCNVNMPSNNGKYKWLLHNIKMPYFNDGLTSDNFDVLLAFESVIIIFYFRRNKPSNIWCFDTISNELVETKYIVPQFTAYDDTIYVMKDKYNYGHIVNFRSGEHYKCSLMDLIPKPVVESHEKFREMLVSGYLNGGTVPYPLKQLIVNYFPLFV